MNATTIAATVKRKQIIQYITKTPPRSFPFNAVSPKINIIAANPRTIPPTHRLLALPVIFISQS